jgi:adenylylsulfate kinase
MLERKAKEEILRQRGVVVWLTGLSGSGKTTLALGLELKLHQLGVLTQVLDGDNIRTGLNSNLGFSQEDRFENIRRIAETAKLFAQCGVVTICCFVSPEREMRESAREIVGSDDFVEVYVSTSLDVCESRDVKGLYSKARAGELKNFTGIDAPFEAPTLPNLTINTEGCTVEENVNQLYAAIIDRIKIL